MRARANLRVATWEEVLRYGARGGHKALRARRLLPPIGGGASSLLIGDATATYTNVDNDAAGQILVALFTASASGTVNQLQFRTNGTANTGVTSLVLGIYDDNGSGTNPTTGAPALGQDTFSGTPAINTWITVSGLSIAVTSGTKYWLAVLPIGALLNFNEKVVSGGSNLSSSTVTSFTSLSAVSSWGTAFANGPIGFQGLSTGSPSFAPRRMPLGV